MFSNDASRPCADLSSEPGNSFPGDGPNGKKAANGSCEMALLEDRTARGIEPRMDANAREWSVGQRVKRYPIPTRCRRQPPIPNSELLIPILSLRRQASVPGSDLDSIIKAAARPPGVVEAWRPWSRE